MMTGSISSNYRLRVKQRLAIVEYAEDYGLAPATRRFGLNRKTIREWRDRWRQDGETGLVPRYPKRRRRRRLDDRMIALIREARVEQRFGAHERTLPKGETFYFPSVRRETDAATRKNVIDIFMRLRTAARIPTGRKRGGFSFHCLRHTGASRMLTNGRVDVKTVAEIGGWADIKVLQRYLHPTAA
jgi:integrase